jgi:hypothetical protein
MEYFSPGREDKTLTILTNSTLIQDHVTKVTLIFL